MSRMLNLYIHPCDCCAVTIVTEAIEEYTMPDGKRLLRLKNTASDETWWYDEDLGNGHERY